MTKEGKDFVDKMNLVKRLMIDGASPYVAMSAALEDVHWLLVFAASAAMAQEIENQ